MKKLLNTLYVTSENSYLALDGENVVIYEHQDELGRLLDRLDACAADRYG